MRPLGKLIRVKKLAAIATLGTVTALPFGGCDFGEFTTTTTTTLDGREVVTFLVNQALITPLQTAINRAVDNFFDRVEDGE